MSSLEIEAQLLGIVTAIACALPGVFLVLRRLALMSDALSHSVLVGIVAAFLLTRNLSSPLLVLGAALTGVVTVSLVELLQRTGLVREDAAIGLVFPLLFSVGVILVSWLPKSIHLDADAVLVRELEIAVFTPLEIGGVRLGPQAIYTMGGILLANAVFIAVFYKELKLATFDAGLAAALGFAPGLLHYGLMTLVSVTAVGAFNAVGSALVVALMIAPPATAYLLTDRLSRMLLLSALLAGLSAVGGYWLARLLNANIGGSMATTAGILFGLAYLFAPERGLLAMVYRRRWQRWEFAQTMLAIHLFNHEGLPEAERESRRDELHEHLRWNPAFTERVVRRSLRDGLVEERVGHLVLTAAGRRRAQQEIVAP
jgi:manganese/zinc/iron transport system permease protein